MAGSARQERIPTFRRGTLQAHANRSTTAGFPGQEQEVADVEGLGASRSRSQLARDVVGSRSRQGASGQRVLDPTGGSGYPWCAAYVSWCLGKPRRSSEWTSLHPHGLVTAIDAWATPRDSRAAPEVGDVFLLYGHGAAASGPYGFVTRVTRRRFGTNEATRKLGGSVEGTASSRARETNGRYRFVRWNRSRARRENPRSSVMLRIGRS